MQRDKAKRELLDRDLINLTNQKKYKEQLKEQIIKTKQMRSANISTDDLIG